VNLLEPCPRRRLHPLNEAVISLRTVLQRSGQHSAAAAGARQSPEISLGHSQFFPQQNLPGIRILASAGILDIVPYHMILIIVPAANKPAK
jgi:hypothetical protein